MAGIFKKKKEVETVPAPVVETESPPSGDAPTEAAPSTAEAETKEEEVEEATPVVESPPSSIDRGLEDLVLDHEDRLEGLEALTAQVAEASPEALRLSALFELHLKAAGTKLGREVGEQAASAAERAKSALEKASEAVETAEEAVETAKNSQAEISSVLQAANAALDATGDLDAALAEMRQIGQFVDEVKSSLDKNLAEFEGQIDQKLAAFREELRSSSTSIVSTPPARPLKPWQRG